MAEVIHGFLVSPPFDPNHSVCIKIPVDGFELSLSLDNSLGAFGRELKRGELMVFNNGHNVTDLIFDTRYGAVPSPDVNDIVKAINWIKDRRQ